MNRAAIKLDFTFAKKIKNRLFFCYRAFFSTNNFNLSNLLYIQEVFKFTFQELIVQIKFIRSLLSTSFQT